MNLKLTGKIVELPIGLFQEYENRLGIDEETPYKNLDSKTYKSKVIGLLNRDRRLTASLMPH